jgi:tetratricopeptide (TPR) repeat protein
LAGSGSISGALTLYCEQSRIQPYSWWPFYRAAWCFNLLDLPDSAGVYAERALSLQPASERCLSELLKSLSEQPEQVLEYSYLVSGGGPCRYRLARAEIELDLQDKPSLNWLKNSFATGTDSVAADAGCWLSILYSDSGLRYIETSVNLRSEEEFYRAMLIGKLIDENLTDRAIAEFVILKETTSGGLVFWQTASRVCDALGDSPGAIEASRRAWEMRKTPSASADLGWKLYFYGRDLMRRGLMQEAVPYLRESSTLWSGESLWAVKSDSLVDLLNQFTTEAQGFGEPL